MVQNLILNRYRLITEAGRGGFATVAAAWDTRIQRRVAIKTLRFDIPGGQGLSGGVDGNGKANAPEPFAIPGLEEARTAARLSDSNIVGVYDFQTAWPEAYIIMELVDGITLSRLIQEFDGPLPLSIVSRVFAAISKALRCAHGKQVLHLDIKPDNVLIDRQGVVKVTDFGMAVLSSQAGYGKAAGGTIGYMPLEQMALRPLDERCDEWALAALTYEMLVGENPFLAPDLASAQRAITEAEVIIPSRIRDDVTEELDEVLFTALSINRGERFESVADFAAEMQPLLGGTRKGKKELMTLVEQITDVAHDEASLPVMDGEDSEGASGRPGSAGHGESAGYGSAAGYEVGGTEAFEYEEDYSALAQNDSYEPSSKPAAADAHEPVQAGNYAPARSITYEPARSSAYDPQPDADAPRESRWRRLLGPKDDKRLSPAAAEQILTRAATTIGCGFLSAVALSNVPFLMNTDGSASSVAYLAILAIMALGAALPSFGTLAAMMALALGLWYSGGHALAVITIGVAIPWLVLSGRFDKLSSAALSTQGILGLAGLGPGATLAISPRCDMREMALSALASLVVAVDLCAGSGSGELLNWNLSLSGPVTLGLGALGGCLGNNADAAALELIASPSTWILALGWVAGGCVGGWFGGYNKRFLRITGVVIAAAVMLATILFAAGLELGFVSGVPALSSVAAVVAGLACGILLTKSYPSYPEELA